jgi:hypothetical protein
MAGGPALPAMRAIMPVIAWAFGSYPGTRSQGPPSPQKPTEP